MDDKREKAKLVVILKISKKEHLAYCKLLHERDVRDHNEETCWHFHPKDKTEYYPGFPPCCIGEEKGSKEEIEWVKKWVEN